MAITSQRPLIVDLGMHDGSDTEFYLAKGFNVVAVEANETLVRLAERRFATSVAAGHLDIHFKAVSGHVGTVDFYIGTEDLWASTTGFMADRGLTQGGNKTTVPCTTLDELLADYPTPYYIKIDVEGEDPACIEALQRLPQQPRYVSFEADLSDPKEVERLLGLLNDMGYDRFKLVNQAVHQFRRLPSPAREGQYVDWRFTKHHSGPFGEESPGPWRSLAEVLERYRDVLHQQAARVEYSASGRIMGMPLSRLHRPLMRAYNLRHVTALRHRWAAWRDIEVGGWFDIHAAHNSTSCSNKRATSVPLPSA